MLEPVGSVKTVSGDQPIDGNYCIHFGVVSPLQSYLHDQITTGNPSTSSGQRGKRTTGAGVRFRFSYFDKLEQAAASAPWMAALMAAL